MPTPLQELNRRRQKQRERLRNTHEDDNETKSTGDDVTTPNSVSRLSQPGTPNLDGKTVCLMNNNDLKGEDVMWSSSLFQKVFENAELPVTNKKIPVVDFFGEKRIYFHSSTFSNSTLFLNSSFFPGIEQGDIIYFLTDKSEKPTIYLEVGPSPPLQSNVAISIQEKLGRYLCLTPQQLVQIGSCTRESTLLDRVEITIVDGCLPRLEMWVLLQSLHGKFVYIHQRLSIAECEIEVSNLSKNNGMVFGGLIMPSTDVLFYRNNCRMYLVLHITREILAIDHSGYLRGEIVTDFCFRKIFELWKQGKTRHLVTILLYMGTI